MINVIAQEMLGQVAWDQLRTSKGTATEVPAALSDLADAEDQASADRAYWRLDNRIVVQGQLFSAAIAAVPVLLAMLVGPLSRWARLRIVDLLLQIGAGTTDVSERPYGQDLGANARAALAGSVWTLYGLALDSDTRLAEAALELVATVDADRDRRIAAVGGLARATGQVGDFARELLQEELA